MGTRLAELMATIVSTRALVNSAIIRGNFEEAEALQATLAAARTEGKAIITTDEDDHTQKASIYS